MRLGLPLETVAMCPQSPRGTARAPSGVLQAASAPLGVLSGLWAQMEVRPNERLNSDLPVFQKTTRVVSTISQRM